MCRYLLLQILVLVWSSSLIIDLSFLSPGGNTGEVAMNYDGFYRLSTLATVDALPLKQSLNVQIQMRLSTETSDGTRLLLGVTNLGAASSAVIAMRHFIERDTTVVPELASIIDANCSNMTVSFVLYDTISSPSYAVEAYLSSPKPDIIVGASRSAESGPLAVCSGVQNVPQISHSSTSISLSDKSEYPQFARTIPSDQAVAAALAQLFKGWNYTYAAILHTNDAYGSAYKQALFTECESRGIRLFSASYQYKTLPSLQAALRDLKSTGANIFVAVIFEEDLPSVVSEAGEMKMMGQNNTMWIFSDGISALNPVANTNPQFKRLFHGSFHILASGGLASDPGYQAFTSSWASGAFDKYIPLINERLPGGKKYNQPGLGEIGKQNFTLSLASDFLRKNAPQPLARTMYDAVMAACISSCTADISFPKPTDFKKPIHYQNLLKTTFQGATGAVAFDDVGDRKNGLILLNGFQFDLKSNAASPPLKYVSIGTFRTSWDLNANLLFSSNTSIPPNDVDVPYWNQNMLTVGEVAVAYIYFSFIVLVCVGLMIWIYANRTAEVIKRSQWLFLEFFLVGNLISAGALPPLTVDVNPGASIACMCVVWFYSVGFVFTFAALFSKTYRIMRIFNNPKMQRLKITAGYLEAMMALIMLPDLIILTAWTVVDPLVWKVNVIGYDRFGQPTNSYGVCVTDSYGFPIAVFLYHLIVLVAGNIIAYKSRHAPQSFQESKWILVSMICTFQLFIVGIPAVAAVYTIPLARFYLIATIIFINVIFIVCAIFIPKIKAFVKGERGEDFTSPHGSMGVMKQRSYERFNKQNNNNNNGNNNNVGGVRDRNDEDITKNDKDMQTYDDPPRAPVPSILIKVPDRKRKEPEVEDQISKQASSDKTKDDDMNQRNDESKNASASTGVQNMGHEKDDGNGDGKDGDVDQVLVVS